MIPATAYQPCQQMDMCSSRPRTAKHLTERKRRARINDSLLQLKSMVFPAIRKDISRHPKMEKADILEMTVRYLKDVQNPAKGDGEANSTGITNFHAGFTECLSEVSSFMSSCESIDIETRLRLLGHLADRCSTINDAEQKPDVSRLQQKTRATPTPPPQQTITRVAAPTPSPVAASVPVSSPTPAQQFANTPNGMVLLLPAQTVQSAPVISVKFPVSEGVLTPPQSPMSPEPPVGVTRLTPSPVDMKPTKVAFDLHSHRAAPYQKHPVRAVEKEMWRPW